jgi:hypothetical protein
MSMRTRKRYNKTPQRRKIPGVGAETYRGTRTPILIVQSGSLGGMILSVTVDQPVLVTGIPQYPDDNGILPTACDVSGPTTFDLTYPSVPAAPAHIPFEEPAVRNSAGGYVRSLTVDFAP